MSERRMREYRRVTGYGGGKERVTLNTGQIIRIDKNGVSYNKLKRGKI